MTDYSAGLDVRPAAISTGEPQPGDRKQRSASLWADAWRELYRNPIFVISSLMVLAVISMAAFPTLWTDADPERCLLIQGFDAPSDKHVFGTTVQGCDMYAHVVYGARPSIIIAVFVTLATTLIGATLGIVSGYYGGWLDSVIARLTDIWFAIPTILGGIVILSLLGERGFFQVSLVLVILGWPTMLRLYRASVLAVKEMDYVEAARALGASDFRILFKHILPNAITPVIIYAAISVGVIIAAEAALSFLGVGLQLPAISWGLMISGAQTRILQAPHLLLFPGLLLSLAVFGFILMGDALRDALDPKGR